MPGKSRKPEKGKRPSPHAWDLNDIQELIDILIKREITEFEYEKAGVRIRVKRGKARVKSVDPVPYTENSFAVHSTQPAPAPLETPHPPAVGGEPPAPETSEDLFIIKSPIVGTFFSASGPNGPPFVKLGDVVPVGQVLCIIEAMKLMNEIESEVAGEIARLYVENGQPVEYGQSLFAIRPSHKK